MPEIDAITEVTGEMEREFPFSLLLPKESYFEAKLHICKTGNLEANMPET